MPAEPLPAALQERPAFACPLLEGAACAAYAIQGLTPRYVLLPESEEDAAAALTAGARAGLAVAPWGGGTLQGLGYPPERLDAVLSLERLNRIVTYEPADLTISVQAGCTLQQMSDALAPNGQMLPFTVAQPEQATIGGLVAANLAGPRRFGAGSYRDLLIGVRVAAPDGTISKAGGLVVKNVSGYDLMKLHLGALGTLGVLLRLNFKVLTRPAVDETAVIAGERAALLALAGEFAGSQLLLDSLELLGPSAPTPGDKGWRLAARLTGSARGVERKRAELTGRCSAPGLNVTWREGAAAGAWWAAVDAFLGASGTAADSALLRVQVLPAQLGDVLAHLEALAANHDRGCRVVAHAGNGAIFANIVGGELGEALPDAVNALGERWGDVVVLSAPVALKPELDLWGPAPAGLALMRSIKAAFDPARTLNRGRYLGRL